MRLLLSLLFSLFPLLATVGCGKSQSEISTCVDCHINLEKVSPSHGDCVSCHGGHPDVTDKDRSHSGMRGKKNPASPRVWETTCGRCHAYQLERVRSSIMNTNAGMIKNIKLTWEGEDGTLHASGPQKGYAPDGLPQQLLGVADLDNLSGELYRKFCASCHVSLETNQVWTANHGAGCTACHFPYNENATYQGADQNMLGKWPYSATHKMTALPSNEVCFSCHNRSGRIALSYQGLNDGNNGLVPTSNGQPGPKLIGGLRNVTSIAPDIHHEKKMECIDCHTSRDIMGDGYLHENMYLQVEITCEDCHGSPTQRPRHEAVRRENEEPVRESRNYKRQVKIGDKMVLTSKGRKYSNVFVENGQVWLVGKRDGKRHESKVITNTTEHTIVGHERMECHSCHSRSVVQCFGCHTQYDQREKGFDFIRQRETPGAFSESEDYRMLYPFPLALNQRQRISTVTPGCQTFVTVIDQKGRRLKEEYVANYEGKNQLRFAPFYGHNTGTKAVGCGECHANPAFIGFGQHVVEKDSIHATLLCEKSVDKPLDGFLTLLQGKTNAFSAITRENSRPLSAAEIQRVWSVNQCLVCHVDAKDPIYQRKLNYGTLDRCLSRPAPVGTPVTGSR